MTLTRTHYIVIAAVVVVLAAAAVLYEMRGGAVQRDAGPPAALAPYAADKAPLMVPQVAITDASGARLSLASFRGRYVLLNLWAPWCAPCVRELPALARLQGAVPKKGFSVVAVDVGRGSAADARAFLDGHGAKALDTYVDSDIALIRAFGVYGLPLSVLIDPKGREIGRAVGPAQWDSRDAITYFADLAKHG
ncbi:MAG TPA: TlpA disulfide reductase family protein [Rhizomicrobium sp.]|nr:TlpA disulfide reductase family protein [Rhizomicrobium sp.]